MTQLLPYNWIFSYILSVLFLMASVGECAKILIFSPQLGYSHVQFMGEMADVLVEAGHNVTVLVTNCTPEVDSNGTRLARVIFKRYPIAQNQIKRYNIAERGWQKRGDNVFELLQLYRSLTNVQIEICKKILVDNELTTMLRNEKFDLGITELIAVCGYAIFHKIGVNKYISASATNLVEIVSDSLGVSSNPSYVPSSFIQKTDVMSYSERFVNCIMYSIAYFATKTIVMPAGESLNKFVADGFNFMEAVIGSSLSFVNTEELLDFPRLVGPKVIFVGGIAVKQQKPIEKEYQQIFNKSSDGVVLVSFGSVMKSSLMIQNDKQSFQNAFKLLPKIGFIWKYEIDDEVATNLSNVYKRKWIPQSDLLTHPNLRLFVSHCGQNSLTESALAGVPLICIPIFGDQLRNSKIAEKRGIGIVLDKDDINEKSLIAAFNEVLYNKKYRKTSQLLAKMIKEKPTKPRDRLIRYAEFVIRYGPLRNFDVAAPKLSFIQYYLIDVIALLASVTLTLAFFCLRTIQYICPLTLHILRQRFSK